MKAHLKSNATKSSLKVRRILRWKPNETIHDKIFIVVSTPTVDTIYYAFSTGLYIPTWYARLMHFTLHHLILKHGILCNLITFKIRNSYYLVFLQISFEVGKVMEGGDWQINWCNQQHLRNTRFRSFTFYSHYQYHYHRQYVLLGLVWQTAQNSVVQKLWCGISSCWLWLLSTSPRVLL